jgi:ABC-type antimicrobial peptide transport system permease subunit
LVSAVRLREIIESIPGVSAVAFGGAVPAEPEGRDIWQIPDPTDPTQELDIRWTMIDSRYIETLGLTLIHGRAPEDNEDHVVLLNQSLARAWWGRDDVVGEPLPFSVPYTSKDAKVIGVLEDLSFGHPSAAIMPRAFMTSNYLSRSYGVAVIETGMTAAALRQELDRIITSGDLEIPIADVLPLTQLRHDVLAADRARGALTIATAVLVVVLSAFGFYGTQRYLVVAGRREYAIRASLGAGPDALGRLVLKRGFFLGMPGLIVGGLLSFVFVAWLRDGLVSRDVSPGIVTIGVVAGLALLLVAASLAPARTARRTQPASLLRED